MSGVIRFGVADTYLGARLPTLLGQFARSHPCVRLEVNVSSSPDFRAMVAAGELDMAVVLAEPGQEGDLPLRSTQFVWSAADNFAPPAGDSLPLAFAPSPCLRRQIGLAALERAAQPWHFTFDLGQQRGPARGDAGRAGRRGDDENRTGAGPEDRQREMGLPALPKAEYVLVRRPGERTAADDEFVRLLRDHS